jgi:hypothetical protein
MNLLELMKPSCSFSQRLCSVEWDGVWWWITDRKEVVVAYFNVNSHLPGETENTKTFTQVNHSPLKRVFITVVPTLWGGGLNPCFDYCLSNSWVWNPFIASTPSGGFKIFITAVNSFESETIFDYCCVNSLSPKLFFITAVSTLWVWNYFWLLLCRLFGSETIFDYCCANSGSQNCFISIVPTSWVWVSVSITTVPTPWAWNRVP